MGKKKQPQFTEEFKREAVRILLSSELTHAEVADDLGVGKSTLGKWKKRYQEAELLSGPHDDLETELRRLKKENELLRQERDILKQGEAASAPPVRAQGRTPSLPGKQVDEVSNNRCEEG